MSTTTPTSTNTVTELLSHLIRMPTVTSDHATNRAALDWVQEQLHDLPLHFTRLEHNGVASLVATTPAVADPKNPKLWLAGHLDVVPGTPEDFKPRIQGGKLYGRGAYDMKYGVAVFIAILQELGEDLAHYDLGLMLTTDEEVGGFNGSGHLAELGYTSKTMLLPECGIPWNMEAGAKSITWWNIESQGKAAHAAYNWLGASAIDQLLEYLQIMKANFPQEPCGDAAHHHNTINIGTITGGHATNQVADVASATLDIRTLPEISLDTVKTWVQEAALQVPGITATPDVYGKGFINRSDGGAQLFHDLSREVAGVELTSTLAHGQNDARFFAPHGTQVITVPPAGGGQHSGKEWINLESLGHYTEITRRFVEQWAKRS